MITVTIPDPTKADGLPVVIGAPKQIFGAADGGVVNGVPQVTPITDEAIYIGADGTQYQWFGGAWH
jgi:hypothetical protein